jgi:hypothetical protein
MRTKQAWALAIAVVLAVGAIAAPNGAQKEQAPTIKIPEPGVPEILNIEGSFVRAAYNNEAYVILGYKTANMSVGDEWMLLEMGTTVLDRTPAYKLKRADVTLDTPDAAKIPLATVEEYRKADLRALENRAGVARDSINYFPTMASQACRIGFFSELGQQVLPWEDVELSNTRACLGRLFFRVPGGIKYGQHWLNVKFEKGLIRVPFRIFTKEEEKIVNKHYKSLKKQVDDAFKPPKKKDKDKDKNKDKQ